MTRPRGDREEQPPKTAIILGAGASAADNAPVQSDLLREYFRLARGRAEAGNHSLRDSALTSYFSQVWGFDALNGDLDAARFPTFEEALGVLEMADARGEFFKGLARGDRHNTPSRELRTYLTASIYLLLEERLRTSQVHHRRLVGTLQDLGHLGSVTFVSLNYDILIDNALEDAGGGRPNYGVEFTGDRLQPERAARAAAPLLLKVHGSLNWLLCPTCNALSLFPHMKIAAHLPEGPTYTVCPHCHQPRVPVIIPPTFFKVLSSFHLQRVWWLAEQVLRKCERLVFCGYSFPDADMHFKYLLKRAEVNRAGEPPEVFTVNEHPKKRRSERKAECARYMRFFRRKDRIHWTKLSFEQFAENPNLIEDPSQWL